MAEDIGAVMRGMMDLHKEQVRSTEYMGEQIMGLRIGLLVVLLHLDEKTARNAAAMVRENLATFDAELGEREGRTDIVNEMLLALERK